HCLPSAMPNLEKIVVQDYKNITLQELSFSPNINCITGNNGEGTEPEQQTFFSSFCETLQAKSETIFCKNSANFAS
ncbi:MAG: hypothetical protein IKM98_06015, partial [Bacteroidales bacterium]|nr:hypothetical protein [Bacteroidales bacterium]